MEATTGPTPATQPLRDEHRALLPEIGALRAAADTVGTPAGEEAFERACRLLERHLLPHLEAEEGALYPTIDRLSGPHATATMWHDHDEIRRRVAELRDLRRGPEASAKNDLRAALYGLDAIVRLHVAKEEALHYPLLDEHLGRLEAAQLVEAVHRTERQLYERDDEQPHT